MLFFDLIIRWVESSDFGPKSDDLAHWILTSDFISSDFAKSDCISRPIIFSGRNITIRSSESVRIINGLSMASFFPFYFRYTAFGVSFQHILTPGIFGCVPVLSLCVVLQWESPWSFFAYFYSYYRSAVPIIRCTRLPSRKCLWEWRKNEIKSIQHAQFIHYKLP